MSLHDTIASDAALFTSTSDFGEAATYFARGGQSRSINVTVERQGYRDDDGRTVPFWDVAVANSGTLGISSTELTLGADQIAFPPRDGQDAVRKTIRDILFQDHGMLVLQCQ